MNRKLILFAVYPVFVMSAIVGLAVPSFASGNVFALRTRTNNPQHIVLNIDNQPHIDSGSGSLTYNDYAHFSYEGASSNANGHVSLADKGTLYKNEASYSLSSFQVSFSGNLILHTGYSGVEDTCYEYTLEDGVSTKVRGNYFKLISSGATDIESIDIYYGCGTEEIETHNISSNWTHNETKHWHECKDPNCVKKFDEANHVVRNLAKVDPTNEETGLTAGTDCSVCGRILSGRKVLPVLDQTGTNYEYRRRTTKVGDVVADFDEYIWLDDTSVVIHNNPGEPLNEYVHAGSSYYSIETWNDLFPNQEAVLSGEAGNRTLTMTLDGDTTVTAEDGVSDLDGTFDLLLYKCVVIKGSGTLNITYTTAQDGIKCRNLTIEENVTLNLTGYSATAKTGISFAGTLQIDGTYNVNKFGNGIGINTDIDASATDNVLINGELRITDCKTGIHAWNTPSGGASINVNGVFNMSNISEQGMTLESAVTLNFNEGCEANITAVNKAIYKTSGGVTNFNGGIVNLTVTGSSSSSTGIGSLGKVAFETTNAAAINFNNDAVVNITSGDIGIKTTAIMTFNVNDTADVNITADKVGLYATYESDDNNLTLNTSASLTVTSTYGSGIIINNQGRVNLRNSSTLEITAAASGLYGFSKLYVCQGALADHTKNSASLKVHISGNGSCASDVNKDGNAIQGRDGASYLTFDTTGVVLIENTNNTQGNYGIHFGSKGNDKTNAYFQVYASNMTIKNFTSAIYCNGTRKWTVNYDNSTSHGYDKLNIVNCASIYSGNTSPISTTFTDKTCNRS